MSKVVVNVVFSYNNKPISVFLKFKRTGTSPYIKDIAKEAEEIIRAEHPEYGPIVDWTYHGHEEEIVFMDDDFCDKCMNASVNPELEPDYDFASRSLGDSSKGYRMMYNTGAIKNNLTKNSILDYEDVYKYLSVNKRIKKFIAAREYNCPVIDVAYPAYSWGVVFYNNHFRKLVGNPQDYVLQEGETIRVENSEIETIQKVKALVDSKIGSVVRGNIIYHLDSNNLSKYSYDEIESIYN